MAQMITVTVDGSPMEIMWDGPAGDQPRPAILLMYHRGGFDDFTKLAVKTLVDAGYRVAVPDVSHRTSRDVPMKDRKQFFKDAEVVADMRAALDFLKARPDVRGDAISLMGHCMGGRMTVLGGGALPGLRSLVVFYGGGVMIPWGDGPATPFDGIKNIACPVIGFSGGQDTNPSPENMRAISAEMDKHGVTHQFHLYPDVGHGFQNPAHDSPAERAAAKDSWQKALAFLAEVSR
ncbi:MAG: dienelactone hydrolase family protein [Alphaproteobacteria bacterium]